MIYKGKEARPGISTHVAYSDGTHYPYCCVTSKKQRYDYHTTVLRDGPWTQRPEDHWIYTGPIQLVEWVE